MGGLSSTILCWGTLLALKELFKVNYLISANVAAFSTYLYSYMVNKYFVFKNRERKHIKHGGLFLVLQIGLWALANSLLFIGVEYGHIHYFIVIVFIAVISLLINYSVMKIAVFS